MKHAPALAVPLCLVALLSALLPAQGDAARENPDPVGDWKGTLSTGAVELRLVLHVVRDGTSLKATLDSVDQGANGIPIDSVALDGRTLTFQIKQLRASFKGTIEGGAKGKGDAIDGTFTQGIDLPLRFERTTEMPKLVRPQTPKAPFPYRAEEVSFGTDEVRLAGTLTLPKGDGPFPAAVLITGSGPQDRDESLMGHKPFLVLADHLTRNGIAVLRYDDRGVGKSTGTFGTAVSDDFADDAEAGLRYLRTRKEIAKGKVGLIGHSEGGLVAPIVAARNAEVAFVVMMAGPGVPGTEILALQTQLIARSNGASEKSIENSKVVNAKLFTLVTKEQDVRKLRTAMDAVIRDALKDLDDAEAKEVGDKDKFTKQQIAKLTSPWMLRFLRYDPRPTLAKVRCPVLAINGGLDLQVDAKQNLPEIAKALKKAGNADFEIVTMPTLNHLFQRAKTGAISEYSKIEETIAPEALERMSEFIRERFVK